jgi:hypothetical protein
MRAHEPCSNAFRAAATARSTSSFCPDAICVSSSPVDGSRVAKDSPAAASTHRPAISSFPRSLANFLALG